MATLAATHPARAQGAREIKIGISSTSFGTAGPRIAKEMGLFAKHGLDARFIVLESGNAATAALISGSIDFSMAGPGDLIAAQARGQKVAVVLNTAGGFTASVVLSKTVIDRLAIAVEAPVMQRLKALDGILLASPAATSSYTASIRNATKEAGVKARFTYMAQPAMVAALERGAIDGYVSGAPFWALSVIRGNGVVWISGPKGDLPTSVTPASSGTTQAMRAYAAANPEIVKALREAWADFGGAVRERPQDVKAAVLKIYPDLDGRTLDLLYPSESLAWIAPAATAADMAHEIDFMKMSGLSMPGIETIDLAGMLVP
jgi:ABC-type nitrate/sulfonate/bicarbonate transport system substrate-binding protein